MSKLLLIILIAVVIYTFLKKGQPRARRAPSGGRHEPEAMLQCTRCGVHFPIGEAVMRDGRAYCSPGHAQQKADRT